MAWEFRNFNRQIIIRIKAEFRITKRKSRIRRKKFETNNRPINTKTEAKRNVNKIQEFIRTIQVLKAYS